MFKSLTARHVFPTGRASIAPHDSKNPTPVSCEADKHGDTSRTFQQVQRVQDPALAARLFGPRQEAVDVPYAPQSPVQLLHILSLPRQKLDLGLGIFYCLSGHIRRLGLPYDVVRDRLGAYNVLLERLCVAGPGGDVVLCVLVDFVDFQLDGAMLAMSSPQAPGPRASHLKAGPRLLESLD